MTTPKAPDYTEIWRQVAHDAGGQFKPGTLFESNAIRVPVGPWNVLIDHFNNSGGHTITVYTRVRAVFVSPAGFRFKLVPQDMFTSLGKLIGLQDVEIGVPDFDAKFIIKGNQVEALKALLADHELRRRLLAMPAGKLQLRHDSGPLGPKLPKGFDMLYYHGVGLFSRPQTLVNLLETFSLTLNRLVALGLATNEVPPYSL